MDMVSCALSSLSLFTFLSHFTSMFHLTRIFHTCLSSALILMLAVTIATTFRVLPNKPGVTPSWSAAGLERTTTKDHNVCVCVCVCVCIQWRSHHQPRGKIQAGGRLERREPETVSLSKCDHFHKTSQEHVCPYAAVSFSPSARHNICVTCWHITCFPPHVLTRRSVDMH